MVGSETIRFVVIDSTLKTIPATTPIIKRARKTRRARTPSIGAYACMKARKLAGIRLPAAKLIGIQKVKCIPPCTAVTAVAHTETITVHVVKRRFSGRLGDVFHTRIAKATRNPGAAKEAMYAIYSDLDTDRRMTT